MVNGGAGMLRRNQKIQARAPRRAAGDAATQGRLAAIGHQARAERGRELAALPTEALGSVAGKGQMGAKSLPIPLQYLACFIEDDKSYGTANNEK